MKNFHIKYKRLTNTFTKFSIFIGIFGTILVFFFMAWQLNFILENDISTGGGFVLPVKTTSTAVFYIPFMYWIISLFVLALVHEAAHGIVAQKYGINIKSSGFAFLGILMPILPAAFVEPDEKQLAKSTIKQQIAVLGAGPASNIVFGILFLIIFIPVNSFTNDMGYIENVSFSHIMNESSLNLYNLSNDVKYNIVDLNGVTDKKEIYTGLFNVSSAFEMTLQYTDDGIEKTNTFIVEPFDSDGKKMIGISGLNIETGVLDEYKNYEPFVVPLNRLLFYLWLLNISIGMINLLPLWITDGGQITRVILFNKYKEQGLKIFNIICILSLVMLIFTFSPNLLRSVIGFFG